MTRPTDLLAIENLKPSVQTYCASLSWTSETIWKWKFLEKKIMLSKKCSLYPNFALWEKYSRIAHLKMDIFVCGMNSRFKKLTAGYQHIWVPCAMDWDVLLSSHCDKGLPSVSHRIVLVCGTFFCKIKSAYFLIFVPKSPYPFTLSERGQGPSSALLPQT